MAHKISVNQSECIGCGACANICPESFEMKKGKAYVKKGEVEKLTCEESAKGGCPVDAISVG